MYTKTLRAETFKNLFSASGARVVCVINGHLTAVIYEKVLDVALELIDDPVTELLSLL